MSGDDQSTLKVSDGGVKGLAMMAPFVGMPFLLHAVSGAVVTGAGVLALASAMGPFKSDIMQAARALGLGLPANPENAAKPAAIEEPSIIVTVTEHKSASVES